MARKPNRVAHLETKRKEPAVFGEECWVKRVFESIAGGVVVALGLLILTFVSVRDAILGDGKREMRSKLHPEFEGQPRMSETELPGEFCFDRAIQGYEALIDAAAAEKRI